MEQYNTIKEMHQIVDAVEKGEKLQFQPVCSVNPDKWGDWVYDAPNFYSFRYRIKPESKETLLTNRELAKWLAQGNGEVSRESWNDKITYWCHRKEIENEVCDENVIIRKWNDTEWHKPTREYAFGEEEK